MVIGIPSMRIHSDQEVSVGSVFLNGIIDPNCLNPSGIVHQNDTPVQLSLTVYDFARAISTSAIGDDNSQVHSFCLGPNFPQHRLDVARLIEARNHHQREGGRPSRRVSSQLDHELTPQGEGCRPFELACGRYRQPRVLSMPALTRDSQLSHRLDLHAELPPSVSRAGHSEED